MAAPIEEQIASDCRHRQRLRTSDGKQPWYYCVRCGHRWTSNRSKGVVQAPEDWERMSMDELRYYYLDKKYGIIL